MDARKRGQRSDHKAHIAAAIIAMAKGKTAWRDISENIGISMRATFDLLRELSSAGRIKAIKPPGIQNHNTKKITYGLLDDIGSFVYYVNLVGSAGNDNLKEFMLTDYYLAGASKVSREVAKYAGEEMLGYFLVLKDETRKDVKLYEAKEAAVALSRGVKRMYEEGVIDNDAVKMESHGWRLYLDKMGWGLGCELHLDDLVKGIYGSRKNEEEEGTAREVMKYEITSEFKEAYNWLLSSNIGEEVLNRILPGGAPNSRVDPFIAVYEETKEEVPELAMKDMFDKIQRYVAILNVAFNDGIFFDVMYKVITTFPDAALIVAREIQEMISALMPYGYKESQLGLLFDKKYHIEDGFTNRIFKRGQKVFYIAEGDVSGQILLVGLNGISSENAVMPERFLEKFILEDLHANR
jgi:hypothetical protein